MSARLAEILIKNSYALLFLLALAIAIPFGGVWYVLAFYAIMMMLAYTAAGAWYGICWVAEKLKAFWLSQYMQNIPMETHRYLMTVYTLLYWAAFYGLGALFPQMHELKPWDPILFAPPLALLFWWVYRYVYYRMPKFQLGNLEFRVKIGGAYFSFISWALLIFIYELTHAIFNFIFKFQFTGINLF